MPVEYVNAQYLNLFVNQVRPKSVAFEKWAGRLNEIAQSDQGMDDGLKVATMSLHQNAKAALKDCDELAQLMGITFPA